SETPVGGTLAAGDCVDIGVTFDSAGLPPGTDVADLVIASDDPDEPVVTVPVTMTVLVPVDITSVTYTSNDLQVAFDATVAGEPPLVYAWDFGDGGTSALEDPTHTYAAGGCYIVTLVVTGGCGQDTWSGQVCVCDPVNNLDFTWQPQLPTSGETVTFAAAADGTPAITFDWDFGDGTTGTGQNPTHVYAAAGSYSVVVMAANCDGITATQTHTLTVQPARYYYYLPIAVNGYLGLRPDLVGSFTLAPDQDVYQPDEEVVITVVITNVGTAVADGFWVDFYINPDPVPTGPGLLWHDVCGLFPCYGLVWDVPAGLAPGQSVTLTSTLDSFDPSRTKWLGYFAPGTTDLYLFVDSWDPSTAWGAVQELDETNNRAERHGLSVPGELGQAPKVAPQVSPR
ncbi:MAG TPA: PKD domain-containing protein, partial [Anaerolineae bacterium]|nr:PKD domain-containing protein [Anaerolineae bacterium]